MKNAALFFFLTLFIFSCGKDDQVDITPKPINPLDTITNFSGIVFAQPGILNLNLSHYFKNEPIVYASKNFINSSGDTFNVENFEYRVSNIYLKKSDSTWIKVGDYFLNRGTDAYLYSVNLSNIPAGIYTDLKFSMGVDSFRNHSGNQTGALDPSLGMYWDWNSGYIFYRIFGRTNRNISYAYDIGGDANLITYSLNLNAYKLKKNTINLDLKMDVNEMFQNPQNFGILADTENIHTTFHPLLPKLVANMGDMITLIDLR